MPQFPLTITHRVFFRKFDEIYLCTEDQEPSMLNEEELQEAITECRENNQQYLLVYHHQMMNKTDFWSAYPDKINHDELDFWYAYRVLSEEDYLSYKAMILQ